jgi:hypothetical protein
MTKKRLWLTVALSALIAPAVVHAQDAQPEYGIKFGGFVKFDAFNDSRQVVGARDDMYFLYPAARSQITSAPQVPVNFFATGIPAAAFSPVGDANNQKLYVFANNEDLSTRGQTTFTAVQSRLTGKITAPDAFGAKVTGMIEGDFFGTTEAQKYAFGLRHAWINLDWGATSMRFGQDWHPLFLQGGIFPGTLQFSPLSPIHPFGRAPQIALTQKMGDLKLSVHLLEQLYHADRDNTGVENNIMIRRAKVPEIAAQLSYTLGGVTIGGTFDHRELMVSDDTNPTGNTQPNGSSVTAASTAVGNNTNRVKMNTYQAFAQLKQGDLTIKASTTMGDSFVNLIGVGGFAVKQSQFEKNMAPALITAGMNATEAQAVTGAYYAFTKREYSPIQVRSGWLEIVYGKELEFGIVGGITENLGARDDINASAAYGRNAVNLKEVMTIAPRVKITSGKTIIGFEYIYSQAKYLEDDKNVRAMWADLSDDLAVNNSNYDISTPANQSRYLNLTDGIYTYANGEFRDSKGKIGRTYTVTNHRIQFSVQQNF